MKEDDYIRCVNTIHPCTLYVCDRKYVYVGPERSLHRLLPDRHRRLRVAGPSKFSGGAGFGAVSRTSFIARATRSRFLQDQKVSFTGALTSVT